MKVRREWALLIGFRLSAWQWRYAEFGWIHSRWLVFYFGPWKVETEFIRYIEDHDL